MAFGDALSGLLPVFKLQAIGYSGEEFEGRSVRLSRKEKLGEDGIESHRWYYESKLTVLIVQ
ncbi:hypothetical protein BVRB_3g068780 [Beta vulgaris subsp. vulgaris]|nr:hypothetical protein BVRB_3g068780 [Beta vulgaris subsp. vulgaris]